MILTIYAAPWDAAGEPSRLDRRQHRKPLPCPPQIQCIGTAGAFVDGVNARRRRAAPARRDHVRYDILRSRKQRLDAAVAAVAYPSLDCVRRCLLLDPVPIADALHPAPD